MLRYLTTRQLKSTDAIHLFSEREKTISVPRKVAEDDSGRFESFVQEDQPTALFLSSSALRFTRGGQAKIGSSMVESGLLRECREVSLFSKEGGKENEGSGWLSGCHPQTKSLKSRG
jgi:hypothetical protein